FSLNNDADDDKDNDDINAKDLNIACSALHEDSIKKNYDNDSDNELDEETHSAEPSALNVDDTIEKKSKKIFECTYKHTCRKIFDTEQHLKDHIVAANNTKPFKCFDRQCRGREEFNRYNFLAIHLKRHHKIDVDICLVCSIKFKTDRDLLLHKRTLWHKESLKKIYENDTAYIKEMNENNHELLSQQNQKDDDADDCFAKKRPKKYGPRLFLCNYKEEHPCQKNFPSQYALIQHLNEHDNNVKNEKLRCKTCKHFFATSWALNRHTKSAVHQKNIETLKEAKSLLSNTSED
ncbi:hypothetical protein EBU24_05810, partial [bacterium]|nr:hypothetical protein [bacterium]